VACSDSISGGVTNQVLFICTGNFYRSRFAEAVFNHSVRQAGLNWNAVSRGLAIHWAEGYLSPFTMEALQQRGIDLQNTGKSRVQLTVHDLENSAVRIAMSKDEHYPMLQEQFPEWVKKIEYWRVPDVQFTSPQIALPAIERDVQILLERLK
jgi:protein-tyrosine phosphatase